MVFSFQTTKTARPELGMQLHFKRKTFAVYPADGGVPVIRFAYPLFQIYVPAEPEYSARRDIWLGTLLDGWNAMPVM